MIVPAILSLQRLACEVLVAFTVTPRFSGMVFDCKRHFMCVRMLPMFIYLLSPIFFFFRNFCCNKIPGLEKVDDATRRGIDCVAFNHKFCSNPTLPHERPIDTTHTERQNQWSVVLHVPSLILINKMLIEHIKKLIKPNIHQALMTPEIISNTG